MSANSVNLDNVMAMKPAPRWSTAWSVIRLLACLLIAAAIVAQATRSIGGAISRNGAVATMAVNFFSFLTVLSNVGSVVVLAIVGVFPRLVPDPTAVAFGAGDPRLPASLGRLHVDPRTARDEPDDRAAWWDPYPFLDPHAVNGYAGIIPYVLGIAVGLAAFGALVVYVGRRRGAERLVEAVV